MRRTAAAAAGVAACATVLAALLAAGPAIGGGASPDPTSTAGQAAPAPFPVDLGGPYRLTDQHGATRTEADPDGRAQLIFFGYANCPNICSAALPLMAEVTDRLAADGLALTPVLITIDPDQDTVATMGPPLAALHPAFVGLTGSRDALSRAYAAFNVRFEPLFQDPEYGWIYSHTGFLHLMDGAGNLLTVLPPVLDAERATGIVRGYLAPGG